jgi:hypothetical protein
MAWKNTCTSNTPAKVGLIDPSRLMEGRQYRPAVGIAICFLLQRNLRPLVDKGGCSDQATPSFVKPLFSVGFLPAMLSGIESCFETCAHYFLSR